MFIKNLKRVPTDDIEENLMISFDALKSVDADLQDIFLDIACFHIGCSKEVIAKILETYYTFVNYKLDILQKRCLITFRIDDDSDDDDEEPKFQMQKVEMHDLLRDMGRKIACNNSPHEHGKYSRLWLQEDIDTVLKHHKGTEAIRGIIPHYKFKRIAAADETVPIAAESFKRMNKLRFLYLSSKVSLTGSFEQTFEDLRWLRWIYCPLKCLPSNFYPQKLVFLELKCSKLRTMGEQNMVFKNLKTLDMAGSLNLITAPNFTLFPCLETLNFSGCRNLRSLPDSICSLRALEVLNVGGCSGLGALPTELGSIESLKELFAVFLSVSKLPDSIGCLSNLVQLSLNGNKNLETLPDSICSLKSLEILDLSVSRLPDSIGRLSNLVKLDLSGNGKLETLPDSICSLRSLEILDLSDCRSLERLPDLSSLKHLKKLDLRDCSRLTEIQDLEELTSLRKLYLSGCTSSFHKCTLTKRLFEILSGFDHKVEVYIEQYEFRDWTSLPSEFGYVRCRLDSGIQFRLGSNASHNFLAFIFAFDDHWNSGSCKYWVKNITNGGVKWDGSLVSTSQSESLIVTVPSSILSIRGDDLIEIQSDQRVICGIYLLNDTENPVTSEDFSTTDNVEEERSYKRRKGSECDNN